jgi:phosphatidate phosphatase APP1
MCGLPGMRALIYVLLALLSCSCASVRVETCNDPLPRFRPRGVTVISDVDDTIKDTHVKLGNQRNPALLLDPFRPWHPVPGMAARFGKDWGPFSGDYRHDRGRTTVVYVSAGPCRYGRRLKNSIREWEFPSGSIILRKGGFFPPPDYKTRAIHPIIKNSPGHHFVLVGDSGEFDPECYGELAREFPEQIDHIYIRNISGNAGDRFNWAFRGIAKRKIHYIPPNLTAAKR